MIGGPISTSAIRIMARMMEPKWLRAHLGWRITAPINDNAPDWSGPVPA